jgi:hypothetical protein
VFQLIFSFELSCASNFGLGESWLIVLGDWRIEFRKKYNIKNALDSMTIPQKSFGMSKKGRKGVSHLAFSGIVSSIPRMVLLLLLLMLLKSGTVKLCAFAGQETRMGRRSTRTR